MKGARTRREICLAPGARGLREGHSTFESSDREDVGAVPGDLGGGR
ncbi:MAG TPA: hypothetical protein VHM69_04050 [Rubrobacter sp.]|nr:hypothetical protein [Rubrobacter sp.]